MRQTDFMETHTISVAELENNFDATFERVAAGERFIITLDGEPAAVLSRPEDPSGRREEPRAPSDS